MFSLTRRIVQFAPGNGGYGLASADGWNGTPILLDTSDAGEVDDWVYGLDVHGDDVAASIREGVWIGTLRLAAD